MNGIKICGTGRAVPEKVVTNQDLEKIVETKIGRASCRERG